MPSYLVSVTQSNSYDVFVTADDEAAAIEEAKKALWGEEKRRKFFNDSETEIDEVELMPGVCEKCVNAFDGSGLPCPDCEGDN